MNVSMKLLGLLSCMFALAGCEAAEESPSVDPETTSIANSIAAAVVGNPQPGAGAVVQSVEAEGKFVLVTVRVPENDPGSDFFSVDGRQREVIDALASVVCSVEDVDLFLGAGGVVQAYIDDVDGDRVAVVFPSDCRSPS